MIKINRYIFIAFAALAILVAGSATAWATWTLTNLGALNGGTTSYVYGLNNLGQVVGYANASTRAIKWDKDNGLIDLAALSGGLGSYAVGINEAGVAVGYSYTSADGGSTYHAFLWKPDNSIQQLPELIGGTRSYGYGINDIGQVAGISNKLDHINQSYPIIWNPDGSILKELSSLPGADGASAKGINSSGMVAGNGYYSGGGSYQHACVWDADGIVQDLHIWAGNQSLVCNGCINDAGQVAGSSRYDATSSTHAFRWTKTDGMINLGTLNGAVTSSAYGMNSAGLVVGSSGPAATSVAALWTVMQDGSVTATSLNSLLKSNPNGCTLKNAFGISDDGSLIAGSMTCTADSNANHGYLLTQTLRVTAFTMPATVTALSVPVTLTATDSVGVAGYMITESAAIPSASDAGWSADPQSEFTFTDYGTKTLYAWAKDADGNVSPAVSRTVNIAHAATVTLGNNLTFTYDGSTKSVTVTTEPPGLSVAITYNGSGTAPSAAGTYAVEATVTDSGYLGSATGILKIDKAPATVSVNSPSFTYDGTPKSATATCDQAGVTVTITYDGSTTVPTNAGTYAIDATVSDPNYQGTASGSLTIAKAATSVTWANPAEIVYGNALGATQLNATASLAGGSFSYTPAAGTILDPGYQTLSVLYTPADTGNYTSATGTATIRVLPNGDMDGKGGVSIADALMALRCAVHLYEPDALVIARGDVAPLRNDNRPDPNGTIDISDALIILKRVVNLLSW